jgi:hypothetical protein
MTPDEILYAPITGTIEERDLVYVALGSCGYYANDETVLREYFFLCQRRRVCALDRSVALLVLRFCRAHPRV